jgi:hypothetical protein
MPHPQVPKRSAVLVITTGASSIAVMYPIWNTPW